MRKTLEEDLMAGPIIERQLWSHDYSDQCQRENWDSCADRTYVFLKMFKYRVVIGRYDTSDAVWDVLGEAFHQIDVSVNRYDVERQLKTKQTEELADILTERYSEPFAVEHFTEFCREHGFSITTKEDGPSRDELVHR